jgi:hypothetical protein
MSGISDNPFVGPRPIHPGEPLYGRTNELRDLYYALQARRIVVLHSPSGAGKSSLVHAGLVPRLREGGFDVWRTIRVNLDPAALPDVPPDSNRYLLSALISLEEELPAERRRSPAQLAKLDFGEYLEGRPRRKARAEQPVVLLFDQFEEVLTVAPRAVEAKRAFFSAIGRALESPKYWALFIIREDYLAAFAPYRDRIPTQMSNTFRLDLLGLDGAREAAVALAEHGGRTFPAVDQLIADLAQVQVQQADGTFVAERGLHIEPVHLQVVCRRLWDALPKHRTQIDSQDLAAHANVSEALGGYYADAIASIAAGDLARERALRDWIGHKLIVAGIRSQIRQEAGASAGLANELIKQLLDCYLVRTEQRAGGNWYELSHDRLVEPITRNNAAWTAAHLHPLQMQAKMWEDSGRAQMLLLSAAALREAEAWAEHNAELLTAGEREYLGLSQAAHVEARRRQRITISLLVCAVVCAAVSLVALFDARAATLAARTAEADAKAAYADADAARQQAERAQIRFKQEAKFGRDAQRVFEFHRHLAPFPNELDPSLLPEAIGWLAELETADFRDVLGTRIPQWPKLMLELAEAQHVDPHKFANVDSDTLRLLFWLLRGDCPSAETRTHVIGVSPELAQDGADLCKATRACLADICAEATLECTNIDQNGLERLLTASNNRNHLLACIEVFEQTTRGFAEREEETEPGLLVALAQGEMVMVAQPPAPTADMNRDSGLRAGLLDGHAVGPTHGYASGYADGLAGEPNNPHQQLPPDPTAFGYSDEFAAAYADGFAREYAHWYTRGYADGHGDRESEPAR